MKTYNNNPEAVSLLTPEQYRVTQKDGTERPFQMLVVQIGLRAPNARQSFVRS
jgi:peptide methionine sulfoxide reductase MsrB